MLGAAAELEEAEGGDNTEHNTTQRWAVRPATMGTLTKEATTPVRAESS